MCLKCEQGKDFLAWVDGMRLIRWLGGGVGLER